MRRMFVFIIIALVFLSGCTSDESTELISTGSNLAMVTSAYVGSLPSSVYEGESISMQFLVENKGDYALDAGDYFLKIKGINPNAFEGDSLILEQSSTADMMALSAFGDGETIVSGQEVLTVATDACYNNDIENDLTLNIHAKSCYKYGTIASASVCFVELTSTTSEICSPSEFKQVTNTIAPVIVTELAQSPAGSTDDGKSKYRFRLKVQNMGPGTVFDNEESIDLCDELSRSDENIVYIESIKVDGSIPDSLDYEGGVTEVGGLVSFRLDSTNTGRFSFIIEQESDIEFEGDLDIELNYAYTQTDVFSTTINALTDQEPNCS